MITDLPAETGMETGTEDAAAPEGESGTPAPVVPRATQTEAPARPQISDLPDEEAAAAETPAQAPAAEQEQAIAPAQNAPDGPKDAPAGPAAAPADTDATEAAQPAATIAPGLYRLGPIAVKFSQDGRFSMAGSNQLGRVNGLYSVENGVLTLDEAQGDTGTAIFPMRCDISQSPTGFAIGDSDGSCALFEGREFTAAE
jgi:hypothetical protein